MASIKERAALRLLDALYDEDLSYAQYAMGSNSKLMRYKDANKNSLLHYMAYSNMHKQTGLLLKLGMDPLAKNKNGETALHWAAKLNSIEVASLLLDRMPECVNEKDGTNCTALHYAAENGLPSMVSMLVKYGADVWARDYDGFTAYDIACEGMTSSCVTVAVLLHKQLSTVPDHGIGVRETKNTLRDPNAPLKPHPLLSVINNGSVAQFPLTSANTKSSKALNGHGGRKAWGEESAANLQRTSSAPNMPGAASSSSARSHGPNSRPSTGNKNLRLRVESEDAVGEERFVLNAPDVAVPFLPLHCNVNERTGNAPVGLGFVVIITVEQCHSCGKHAWCLWHDEEKYTDTAEAVLLAAVCSILSTPQIPAKVVAMRSKAPKARMGALEVVVSALVTDIMGPWRFIKAYCKSNTKDGGGNDSTPAFQVPGLNASSSSSSNIHKNFSYTPDPRNGGVWIHHVLHSKLKSKTWPKLEKVQESLHKFLSTLKNHSYAGKLARSEARDAVFRPSESGVAMGSAASSSGTPGSTNKGGAQRTTPRLTRAILRSSAANFWQSGLVTRADADYDASEQYAKWWRRMEGKETVEDQQQAEGTIVEGNEETEEENHAVKGISMLPPQRNPSSPLARYSSAPIIRSGLSAISTTPTPTATNAQLGFGRDPSISPLSVTRSANNGSSGSLVSATAEPEESLSANRFRSRSEHFNASSISPTGSGSVTPTKSTVPDPAVSSATLQVLKLAEEAAMRTKEKTARAAFDAAALPCFLQRFDKPTFRSKEQASTERKTEALAEYESNVLAHFLAFDNSRQPEAAMPE